MKTIFTLVSLFVFGLNISAQASEQKSATCANAENPNQTLSVRISENSVRVTGADVAAKSHFSCDQSIADDEYGESEVPMFYLYCSNSSAVQYVTYIGIPVQVLDGKSKQFQVIFGENAVYGCSLQE